MELDEKTKLDIYRLVLNRYKDVINEKESHSISEVRQKVSPYNDFIRKLRERILERIIGYDYQKDFITAVQEASLYLRTIRTCEFAFAFWMDFEDMDKLKVGTAMDKAILFAALLRSLGSEDVRVVVTKSGKPYVRFSAEYLLVPDTGSLLVGEDATEIFSKDPPSYSFNDLIYENYTD